MKKIFAVKRIIAKDTLIPLSTFFEKIYSLPKSTRAFLIL